MNSLPYLLCISAALAAPAFTANVVLYGPSSYRQRSESPFYEGIQRGTILLEDFEDGLLNTPGVSITTGSIVRFQGVDEDDGVLDGLGYVRCWFTNTAAPGLEPPFGIEIKLAPNPQGQYPNYVGFALLGFNLQSSPLNHTEFYQFFGPNGESLTAGPLESVAPRVPNDSPTASAVGGRFVGAFSDTGISRIIIGATTHFDHLQFGYSVPEPSTVSLAAGALLVLNRRKRR